MQVKDSFFRYIITPPRTPQRVKYLNGLFQGRTDKQETWWMSSDVVYLLSTHMHKGEGERSKVNGSVKNDTDHWARAIKG